MPNSLQRIADGEDCGSPGVSYYRRLARELQAKIVELNTQLSVAQAERAEYRDALVQVYELLRLNTSREFLNANLTSTKLATIDKAIGS